MKLNKLQSGSMLLVLVLIITVLTIFLTQRLRSGSFNYDVVLMRMSTHKKQWATKALLEYAIAWCKAHKDMLIADDAGKRYELSTTWQNYGVGHVVVVRTTDGVAITAQLTQDKINYPQQGCVLAMTPLSMMVKSYN